MFFGPFSKRREYTPPLDRRFQLADDPFTRERVTWVRAYQQELSQRLGYPVALGVFGSLSKGKTLTAETAPKTDIDLEVTLLVPSVALVKKQMTPTRRSSWGITPDPETDSFSDTFVRYKEIIWNRIQSEQHPFPIDTQIHGYVDTDDYFEAITQAPFQTEKEDPLLGSFTWHDYASAFVVDVGGSLRPVRQRVLYALKHFLNNEQRTQAWGEIRNIIAENDGRSRSLIDQWLPPSFEAAEALYGTVKPGTPIAT